jgi:hypothetical protein
MLEMINFNEIISYYSGLIYRFFIDKYYRKIQKKSLVVRTGLLSRFKK